MNQRIYDPITGQPITNNQQSYDAAQTIELDKFQSENRAGQDFNQFYQQGYQQNPWGQENFSFQQPFGNPNGQPFGQGYQQPAMNPYGQSYQQPMNNQFGQPMSGGYGQPMQVMNSMYGQPYQMNMGQNPYQGYGQPKKNKLTPQSVALGSSIAAVIVLTALFFSTTTSRANPYDQNIITKQSPTTTSSQSTPGQTITKSTPASVNESAMFSSFSVNGKQYALPMSIDELLANGWTYDDKEDANKTLYAGDCETVKLNYSGKGKDSQYFGVINHSIDAQPLSKCLVYDCDFSDSFVKQTGAEVKFYNDKFTLQKTTVDEVKNELGEPSSTNTSGNSVTLTYRGKGKEDEFNLSATYSFENNVLTFISIRNKTMPADFVQPAVSSKTPDYLGLYKAPLTLGDDLLSGNFTLDGTTYNLPVPYKTLAEQGWTSTGESESVPSMNGVILTLKKGDFNITAKVVNPLPNAVTLDNTIVVFISAFNSTLNPLDLTMAGDIKLGMSKADLESALNAKGIKNFTYNEKFNTYKIPFDQADKSEFPKETIEIYLSDDKNIISSIDIERYDWLSEK
ncbi:hypothetical protein [Butyrivibrio sp. M55]|uniref:hypothetical protein n=1 Tax=Butyrivibrio sp. M55 TaxID=1855323 RepID=UPI0008F3CE85|nr:hypothetical protein [Butyrivibrio sp. M55]SFU84138.1 hypothetical protein SAMN05216540_11352 [Butyrivibrio sp. M55]